MPSFDQRYVAIWAEMPDPLNPPDGSPGNPFDGSTQTKLDLLLSDLSLIPPNIEIVFGPGIFRTRGGRIGTGFVPPPLIGWLPRSGWRIRGAGMYATVLRFVWDIDTEQKLQPSQRHVMISGSDFLSDFSVEDMTLDCNVQNAPFEPNRKFAVGAMGFPGENIQLRRVRFINFGTRTPPLKDGLNSGGVEEFVFGAGGRALDLPYKPSFNAVLEDCIVEQPYSRSAREVSAATMGSGVDPRISPPVPLHLEPFGSVVRNCYFNFDFVNGRNGPAVPVTSVNYTPGLARVTLNTLYPHNVSKAARDHVKVRGAANLIYNGRFEVRSPLTDDPTSRSLEIELPSDPLGGPGGNVTVEQSFLPTLPIVSLTTVIRLEGIGTGGSSWIIERYERTGL